MNAAPDLRRAAQQRLQTERLLGLRELPVAPALSAGSARCDARSQPAKRATGSQSAAKGGGAPSASRANPTGDRAARLRVLDDEHVKGCTKCGLSQTRTNTVFGQGNPNARLVFVGEAPGFEEDKQGLAFVGRAGQLLTKMIDAMTLSRDEVFICNVLKCRPPNNRDPAPDEIVACSPYLLKQLRILQPEVIVALGAPASKTLLDTEESIGRLRGRFHDFRVDPDMAPIPLMPTYHPAYLLRSPNQKAKTWADLQMVMARLGLQR